MVDELFMEYRKRKESDFIYIYDRIFEEPFCWLGIMFLYTFF